VGDPKLPQSCSQAAISELLPSGEYKNVRTDD
jgi:hypothetical protein